MPNDIQVLDEEETRAWRALMRANATLVNKLDRELEVRHNLGLPDYEVLTHLSTASDRSLRMTELARDVLLSPSGLTRRLDGLVKAGLVERQPCPSDGRGLLAVITSKGADKLREMTPTHVSTIREHFVNCISRGQLTGLIDVLEQVADEGKACPPESAQADVRAEQSSSQVNTSDEGSESQNDSDQYRRPMVATG